MNDDILEPLEAYKRTYAADIKRRAAEMFDGLVAESGIDIEQNRATVKKYRAAIALADRTERELKKLTAAKYALILLLTAGAIAVVAGICAIVIAASSDHVVGSIVAIVAGAAAVIVAVPVLKVSTLPAAERKQNKLAEQVAAADALKAEAERQTAPLNALFDDDMTAKLIEAAVPIIKIDRNFGIRRYEYLSEKYGFGREESDRSTTGILTGEILGNPFAVHRELVHSTTMAEYTGSLTISWTETEYDRDGRAHTVTRTQTLYASVTKPKPVYREETTLVYGNDAATELHFSRTPTHCERMTERELARKVGAEVKRIRRRAKESPEFTEMGNETFDALFGALDRDNEVQFRLLFTPLAQKNMLALMRDGESGYGDDFYFRKAGGLNYIISEHSAGLDLDAAADNFRSFDADEARRNFISFNTEFFRSLFFSLAPLLSVPLYQQMKPREYIYKNAPGRNISRYEAEYAVNRLYDEFRPAGADTPGILKTARPVTDGTSDRLTVTANAFRGEDRTDYVSVFGGDGNIHAVPVHWVEYLPVTRSRDVMLKEMGLSARTFEHSREAHEAMAGSGVSGYGYGHGILCCLTDGAAGLNRALDDIIKNNLRR